MNEKPILFSGPMVKAILDGRKTVTRRVVKPQPPEGCVYRINGNHNKACCFVDGPIDDKTIWVRPTARSKDHLLPCPYGQPGDRLWVRETHGVFGVNTSCTVNVGYKARLSEGKTIADTDGGLDVIEVEPEQWVWASKYSDTDRWRPSIFMPRWASRITLEILSIDVERLQQITLDGVVAEGIEPIKSGAHANQYWREETISKFSVGWDRINGKREGCSWNSDPWVWVIGFKRT